MGKSSSINSQKNLELYLKIHFSSWIRTNTKFFPNRIEPSTLAPEQYAPAPRPVSITTAGNTGNTGRALYNTTSAQNYDQNQYDPYYALYDDDVELYRDVGKYQSG